MYKLIDNNTGDIEEFNTLEEAEERAEEWAKGVGFADYNEALKEYFTLQEGFYSRNCNVVTDSIQKLKTVCYHIEDEEGDCVKDFTEEWYYQTVLENEIEKYEDDYEKYFEENPDDED